MNPATVKDYLLGLQRRIVASLENLDGKPFREDRWDRPQGGGGISRVIEEGKLFERGGVNFSHVQGRGCRHRHRPRAPNWPGAPGKRWACRWCCIRAIPTAHGAHERALLRRHQGGRGTRLVVRRRHGPHALLRFRRRRRAFPSQLQATRSKPFGAGIHARFKAWCDDYFFLKHRNEPRGVGGIFFDDFNQRDFDTCFALTQSVGEHFLAAYEPIVLRRRDMPYGERERDFQAYRRGRYVEFNLVYDRGTLFGLQSGGRTEAILMSLPPVVKWRYDWKPEPGSPEAALYRDFLVAKDWV